MTDQGPLRACARLSCEGAPALRVALRRGRRDGRGLRISGSSLPSRVVMVSLIRLDELEKRNLFWTGVAIGAVVVLGILFAVLF